MNGLRQGSTECGCRSECTCASQGSAVPLDCLNVLRRRILVAEHGIDSVPFAGTLKGDDSILGIPYPGERSLPPSCGPSGATLAFMTSHAHLNELGESLKARRAELTPRTVCLPEASGRHAPGLRGPAAQKYNLSCAACSTNSPYRKGTSGDGGAAVTCRRAGWA